MFKLTLVTIAILACANGRPQNASPAPAAAASASASTGAPANVTFLKNDRTPLDDKGAYSYDIELSDGTKFNQMGNTEAPGAGENETSIVIKGSYSYIAPDGTPVNVMYIANKDGFQPTGDVIPKAATPGGPAATPPTGGVPAATPSAGGAPAAIPQTGGAPVVTPPAGGAATPQTAAGATSPSVPFSPPAV